MVDADRCISCGEIIPEGRLVCPACQKRTEKMYIPDDFPEETQIRIGRYYGYVNPYIPYNVSEWLVDNGFSPHRHLRIITVPATEVCSIILSKSHGSLMP